MAFAFVMGLPGRCSALPRAVVGVHRGSDRNGRRRPSSPRAFTGARDGNHLLSTTSFLSSPGRARFHDDRPATRSNTNRPNRIAMGDSDSDIDSKGNGSSSGNVPVNAPSVVLLLTSSVLAIASIGCVFELSGGKPTYGPTVTSAILALSAPGFLFFFYAAIRKGQQEALEDP